ncbi:RHS repeat-associated core domain-containing protein [Christiangramia sp. SM2212]|uniref:RHS repeat-associated core domain-containing protein n=1 Tax=Christiangramia sediminicola TaxID=3073267 RepID=A0ABU1ETE5_9FLAO|nr:RHS repeat-associated core domain-containing protein [Christiangramia sp. SM2212]MDR5591675.1 RHS repeat-associated core domain-containing protein [Christiangramia sp. SM2212]
MGNNNYYPYGSLQPGRHGNSGEYRYGFNGMENDNELKGEGNSIDYGARMYDPRIGRWFAPDPMEHLLPSSSTFSYANNNPVILVDSEGELPILPLLLKAGAAGAADMFLQVAMSYYFDDDVQDISQAFEKVNWLQVSRSAAEGLIPWKTPGGKLGAAALTASGDVMINATTASINGQSYTESDALNDFAVGFLGSLAGESFGELLAKHGPKKVAIVLSDLGFDDQKIEEIFTGAGTTWKGKVDYSDIPDHRTVGPGKNFTQTKKKAIHSKNKTANNGRLRSDEDGTFLNPSKKGGNDPLGAEVDHIVPKSKGGSNSSKNAQVLSKKQNLKKRDN